MDNDIYIFTLHKYFIWADRMRFHFNQLIRLKLLLKLKGKPVFDYSSEKGIQLLLYMSYWYAGMYVVIEGWKKLALSDPKIDNLLESPNVDLLRRYRNGVFHFQKEYFNEKFMGFIDSGFDAVTWIRELREEFSRFFLDWFKQKKAID